MPIIIKSIHVTADAPTICVPITGVTAGEIYEAARTQIDMGVRMLEWRVDYFEDYRDGEALREVLDTLRDMTRETILLVTVRTTAEGGNAELDEEALSELYDSIAQAHAADIIDVEVFRFADATGIIERLHERGALVLLSHHEAGRMPTSTQMEQFLVQMADMDGDLIKLAVMPRTFYDTLRLMEAASIFHEKDSHVPMIAIAMGSRGVLSRLTGELFGSCITFAVGDEASAPGQLAFDRTKEAVDFVHGYLQ